jgi:cytochrome c-type biogenesis protein CcsB
MSVIPFEIALTLYFAAVIIGLVELVKGGKALEKLMLLIVGLAFVNHTVSIVHRYAVGGHLPITSPHEAASFFAWCIVLLFFAMEFRYKVGLLASFVMPFVFALMLISSLMARELSPLSPTLQSYWLGIHIFFAFMSNAAFALACGVGIMYLVQEHYLKSKKLGDLFERLPSIQTLDYLNYRLITLGYPALILAIITGALWGNTVWGHYWRWDPREVWSLATMFIYSIIVHSRLLAGWRGRRAAILSILGFITVLGAFFVIKVLKYGMHVFS